MKLQAEASNFTKSNTPPWVFSRFLNCTYGTKWCKASHLYLMKHCDPRDHLRSRLSDSYHLDKPEI